MDDVWSSFAAWSSDFADDEEGDRLRFQSSRGRESVDCGVWENVPSWRGFMGMIRVWNGLSPFASCG